MLSINETDFGTPLPIKISKNVTLTIDAVEVTVPEGTSVLRAAATAGIGIPKLCATEMLDAFGSCRLCLVQIQGMKGYPASCTTPVAAGMQVTTQNAKLGELRRGVMELYLSDHALDERFGTEMQRVAQVIGVDEVRYGYDGANHLDAEKDESNPYFRFDPAQCIVCSRCVRACDEVQGTFALTVAGRGFA